MKGAHHILFNEWIIFYKSIDIKKNFKYTNIKQHSTLTEKNVEKIKKKYNTSTCKTNMIRFNEIKPTYSGGKIRDNRTVMHVFFNIRFPFTINGTQQR